VDNTADCNDFDATVNPGATEIPDNGADEDCDFEDGHAYYGDGDGDGYGGTTVVVANTQPTGTTINSTDCDDAAPTVHPGATETADNGTDEDCDGLDAHRYYADADGDLYGNPAAPSVANTQPTGTVANAGDCDDAAANVHPGATETADNGVDEDCDGFDAHTWYADADGDLYGNPAAPSVANTQPAGTVANAGDCDDTSAAIHPGATDVPNNGVDEDCNGVDTVSNQRPAAGSQTVNTNEDTAVTVTLSATDADDDPLAFRVTGQPVHGKLGVLSAANCTPSNVCTATVVYTPALNYNGADSFAFSVTDPAGLAAATPGTVTLGVTAIPDLTSLLPGSKGTFVTLTGTKATLTTIVSSTDPICVPGRVVSFSIAGGSLTSPVVLTSTPNKQGVASVSFTGVPGTYSATVTTPATSACAAGISSAGTFVIASNKKVR
jgi:hypothetical protein